MKSIVNCIKESYDNDEYYRKSTARNIRNSKAPAGKEFVAVVDHATNDMTHKTSTSEKVMSYSNYMQHREGVKQYTGVTHEFDLLGFSSTREGAEGYLEPKQQKQHVKSKINTHDADYLVYGISCGSFNLTSGKTKFDWSIYDNGDGYVFFTDKNIILYGTKDTFKTGDTIWAVDNDTQRAISRAFEGKATIIGSVPATKEDITKLAIETNNVVRTSGGFGRGAGYKWRSRMSLLVSVKGVEKA